jgi:thiamine biosynthesis protein ThiS
MIIKINGKEKEITQQQSLMQIIEEMQLDVNKIVVEHNLIIIPKENLGEINVKEDDNIEIVSFVGGG